MDHKPKGPRPRRFLECAAVLSGVLLAFSCGSTDGSPSQGEGGSARTAQSAEASAVRVEPVVRAAMSDLYATSATLRAQRSATITARTRGRVRALLVEEGDRVRADQVVARLEDDEQKIAFERSTAELATLERELGRLERLFEGKLVSETEFEKVRRDAETARHGAALAELELSRTEIRAPFDGVVVERLLDVGATVADGTAVFEIADLDPLEADVSVPERHVARLGAGQRVRLFADATAQSLEASVLRIAPAVDPETGTVKVTLAVDAKSGLRPGAFVRVEIVSDTRADALVVARRALVAEGSRFRLFRVNDSEKGTVAEEIAVRPGYEERDRVEIREVLGGKALAENDRVVVLGAPALSDGAAVAIVENGATEESGSDVDRAATASFSPRG